MKIKTLLLLCMCAIGTTATCKPADPPSGAEQIYLQGRLDFSASPDDVEAYVDDNAVYVQFNQNFGNVTVTLYNPLGLTVYSGVVNTAVQQTLVIPVTLFVEGTYTLTLENVTGYADGEFEKNNSN